MGALSSKQDEDFRLALFWRMTSKVIQQERQIKIKSPCDSEILEKSSDSGFPFTQCMN